MSTCCDKEYLQKQLLMLNVKQICTILLCADSRAIYSQNHYITIISCYVHDNNFDGAVSITYVYTTSS